MRCGAAAVAAAVAVTGEVEEAHTGLPGWCRHEHGVACGLSAPTD
jgi:hypothetical protein